ncbi:MAG: efflux RND transporter periplasmic adaptor subunit [Capsulimonas sp.]|uniref:efflux RND transporter periplasmic adaptor subunit n=1 Tax=Capsulimonas sp. TaxID=2494211 RepID=UPI003265D1F7
MKRLPMIIALVLIVACAVFVTAKLRGSSPDQQVKYKVAAVETGAVKKTISATGTLQPWSTVDIKSKAGGRVNQLLVDVGSVVKANQVLAKIDPSDTQLAVNTAQAQMDSAIVKTQQAAKTYGLQVTQSQIAIQDSRAALLASQANRQSAVAKLADARSQATAQPSQTAATIAQARANLDQAIKARTALTSTNQQDVASARSAYDQALANQKNAQAELTRQKTLLQKGYVSQQSADAAQAAYDVSVAQTQSAQEKTRTIGAEQQANAQAADARVAQTKAALQSAQAGSVDIATKRNAVAQAQAALAQADAQVKQSQVALNQSIADQANNGIKQDDIKVSQASIASNKASLTNATTTLDQTVVRSPTDGIILTKYVGQGTIITSGLSSVATGTAIVQLGDISRMYVNVTVDETDVANVDPGQAVEVDFDAYPGIPFEGKVSRIDPLAVVTNNVTTFNVRVEIDNSTPTFRLLKPGMNANCQFMIDEKSDVIAVPSEAVQSDDNGSYVQIATGGKPAPADPTTGTTVDPNTLVGVKLEKRTVETGLEGDDATEVTSGLKPGEKIVTQTITPAPPASATAGTSSPFAGGGGGRGGGGGGRGRG